ncbi:MAG TPA: hypothetical protein VHB70_11255 [Parafilimonas sp.]|nr:hypothetical protein [Parafilimonas sp.]
MVKLNIKPSEKKPVHKFEFKNGRCFIHRIQEPKFSLEYDPGRKDGKILSWQGKAISLTKANIESFESLEYKNRAIAWAIENFRVN